MAKTAEVDNGIPNVAEEVRGLIMGYLGEQAVTAKKIEAAEQASEAAKIALRGIDDRLRDHADALEIIFAEGVVIDGVKDGHGLEYHADTKLPSGYENGMRPLTEEQIEEHTHQIWKPATKRQIKSLVGRRTSNAERSNLMISILPAHFDPETAESFDPEPFVDIRMATSASGNVWYGETVDLSGKLSDLEWHSVEAELEPAA